MLSEQALLYGNQSSAIRTLFEYGRKRAAVVGRDKICDFSLGNPSVPPPQALFDAFEAVLKADPMDTHGYTSAVGCDELRAALAESMTRRFGMALKPENFFITAGAAAALTACFCALTPDRETEFIALAPYFPEYKVYSETLGAHLRIVPADEVSFQIDFDALEKAVNRNTRGVVINSPNNPSGVVYTRATLERLAELLRRKSSEVGHPIFLISDEPYRELVYGGAEVTFVPSVYENTLVCYSWSKCLSMPGDRLGYVLVPEQVTEWKSVFAAIAGASRMIGHVCAPSIVQKAVAKCVDAKPDLTVYERNRNLLLEALPAMGYECARPDGAFYLFFRSPRGSGNDFSEEAKAKDLLLVPAVTFGCPNHLRIAYCVDTAVVERSLPVFKELMEGR